MATMPSGNSICAIMLIGFDVDCFLLFGEESTYPAVMVRLGAVTAVVLIGRDGLDFGGFG